MTTNVRCLSCDTTLLAFESGDPTPINRDQCPTCGATEFSFVESGDPEADRG